MAAPRGFIVRHDRMLFSLSASHARLPAPLLLLRWRLLQSQDRPGLRTQPVLSKAVELVAEFMEKRGNPVPNKALVAKQVGVGAVVFNDLVNDRVKNVEFDWERVLDFEGDSGPYVQYCGVRCASLIRKYGKPIPNKISVELSSPEEVDLIRTLLAFDITLSGAFKSFRPHILAGYLIDVCHKFSQFYTKHRILGEDPAVEAGRMALVQAVFKILEKGLGVLSIELPEAM